LGVADKSASLYSYQQSRSPILENANRPLADLTVDEQTREVPQAGQTIDLTSRICCTIKSQVSEREQIITQVREYDFAGDIHIVDVYTVFAQKIDTGFEPH
jgi:DNA-binding response OmpR family regulator